MGCHLRRKVFEFAVSHETHNPKVGGSNPPPATKSRGDSLLQVSRILKVASRAVCIEFSNSPPRSCSCSQNVEQFGTNRHRSPVLRRAQQFDLRRPKCACKHQPSCSGSNARAVSARASNSQSSAVVAGVHHGRFGTAWGGRAATPQVLVTGRRLLDCTTYRNVCRQCERGVEGHNPARQTGYPTLVTNSDADSVYCTSLVVNQAVGI